jgi:S-adenosyl methyltransferase
MTNNVRTRGSDPLAPFDAGKPGIARLRLHAGREDNFAADCDLVARTLEVFPLSGVLARENRQFPARAVAYVSGQRVAHFTGVGSGLPASPSTHKAAGRVRPDARVVYADNDPVGDHARRRPAPLARNGRVSAVPGACAARTPSWPGPGQAPG